MAGYDQKSEIADVGTCFVDEGSENVYYNRQKVVSNYPE